MQPVPLPSSDGQNGLGSSKRMLGKATVYNKTLANLYVSREYPRSAQWGRLPVPARQTFFLIYPLVNQSQGPTVPEPAATECYRPFFGVKVSR